jgi:hypothetical protein
VFSPLPVHVPWKAASGPSEGVGLGAVRGVAATWSKRKSLGIDTAGMSGAGITVALASTAAAAPSTAACSGATSAETGSAG